MTHFHEGEALTEAIEEAYELLKLQEGFQGTRYNWKDHRAHRIAQVALNALVMQDAFEGKGLAIAVLREYIDHLEVEADWKEPSWELFRKVVETCLDEGEISEDAEMALTQRINETQGYDPCGGVNEPTPVGKEEAND